MPEVDSISVPPLLLLPNEMLLEVFSYLDSQDLLALAVQCRRLHYLSLPLYFSHHRVPDRPSCLEITASPGIRISLFTTSLKNIILTLEHKDTDDSLFQYTDQLQKLVLSLKRIGSMQLKLVGFNVQIDRERWRKSFEGLLAAVVKRCPNLRVDGGVILEDAVRRRHSEKLGEINSSARTERFRSTCHDDSKLIKQPAGRLTQFTIRSSMLLRPPFIDWTVSTISSCTITSLTLSALDILPFEWATLLRTINLQSLRHFSLTSYQPYHINFTDICSFVLRHSSITTLALRLPHDSAKRRRISKTSLPKLETLNITTPLATSCLVHSTSYPRLRFVSLISPFITDGEEEEELQNFGQELDNTLGLIMRRANVVHLRVELSGLNAYRLIEWHSALNAGRVLPYITRVDIWAVKVNRRNLLACLPKWLSTSFPNIRILSIEAMCIPDDKIRSEFLHAVLTATPKVEVLKMNEIKRSVADWTRTVDLVSPKPPQVLKSFCTVD